MEAIKIGNYENHPIKDFEVIKKVLSGEKGLYEILMRRNNQKLFRVVRSYINEESLIKDIMQNTYIKAYEKLYQFKQKSTFSTWLIRIGINETLKELNSKRYNTLNDFDNLLEAHIIKTPDSSDPEKEIIQKEVKYILEKTIDNLPSKYKTVYILKEVEGMRISDISKCLNLTEGNVKVRIHRSKQILKDELFELSKGASLFEFGSTKCDTLVSSVLAKI